MSDKEKFPYELDEGAVVDFADGQFMLVIKDDSWNEDQLVMSRRFDAHFCWTADLAIFVVEGGPVDSSDFYFNIQECDQKDELLKLEQIPVSLYLVDGNNDICFHRQITLNKEDSAKILEILKKQNEIDFMPGEFDVNVQGIQSAYLPFELNKFSKVRFMIK